MFGKSEEGGGISQQNAGVQDIGFSSGGAATGQVTPSYSVF
jgi:hypothetical protein